MLYFLFGAVVWLVIDRVFFIKKEDKLARMAIEALAKELNLRVVYYPYSNIVGVYTVDFDKKYEEKRKRYETTDELAKIIKDTQEDLGGKTEALRDVLSSLVKHFGLKLEYHHEEEKNEIRIVKLKK